MSIEKWACRTVTGSCKIACSKHFLLIYVVFQSLYYSSKVDCFGFQAGKAPDDQMLGMYMIVKFFLPKSLLKIHRKLYM